MLNNSASYFVTFDSRAKRWYSNCHQGSLNSNTQSSVVSKHSLVTMTEELYNKTKEDQPSIQDK